MAAPVVAAVAGATGRALATRFIFGVAQGIGAGIAYSSAATAYSPATRRIQYETNFSFANLVPEIPELLNGYYAGKISHADLVWLLKHNGVDPTIGSGQDQRVIAAWGSIIEARRPTVDVGNAIDLHNQGLAGPEFISFVLDKHGIRDRNVHEWLKKQFTPYSIDFIRQQWALFSLRDDEAKDQLSRHGYGKQEQVDKILKATDPLDITIGSTLFHRGYIDNGDFINNVRGNGYQNVDLAQKIVNATYYIPGPSDIISFAVREVWDEAVVDRFGYDLEFPERFAYWMKKQGADYDPALIMPDYRFGDNLSWSKAFWRAHWTVISPSQAYEMLHRLRPTGGIGGGARNPLGGSFTLDDVNTVLKIADYPQFFRNKLAAISYLVPGRIDTRRMLQFGVIDQAEAIEQYKDMGYDDTVSRLLVRFAIAENEQVALNQIRDLTRKRIEQAYRLGVISQDDALIALYRVFWRSTEQQERIAASPRDTQLRDARAHAPTMARIQAIDSLWDLKMVEESRTAIRNAFIRWETSEQIAGQRLRELGIDENSIRLQIRRWVQTRNAKPRHVTGLQLVRFVNNGLISAIDAFARLRRMGYTDLDARTMVNMGRRQRAISRQKEIEKTARTAQVRQAAIRRQAQLLKKERDKVIEEALKIGTPATLKKWLKLDLITPLEIRLRLSRQGRSHIDIERFLEESMDDSGESSREKIKELPAELKSESPSSVVESHSEVTPQVSQGS